jgi:phosphatidylinositol glycan class B
MKQQQQHQNRDNPPPRRYNKNNNTRHKHHLFTLPFALAFCFRIVNAFAFLRTFHSADEHYQGPEIAHEFTFGYGLKTWEWREDVRLRSFAHPLLLYAWPYALVAKFVKVMSGWFDVYEFVEANLVRATPRAMNAAQCALIDVGTYRLARKWYNNDANVAKKAFALSLLSHWHFYCGCRSFANATETAFVVWALVFWPSGYFDMKRGARGGSSSSSSSSSSSDDSVSNSGFRRKSLRGLVLAFVSCTVRPTAYAFWFCVGAYTIFFDRDALSVKQRVRFSADAFWIGSVVLSIEACVNYYYYNKKWTFPAWNFFEFNVLREGASQYGTHSDAWVFTQGLPVVLGVLFPVSLYEIFIASSSNDDLNTISAVPDGKTIIKDNDGTNAKRKRLPTPAVAKVAFFATVFIVSIPKHKEFRFLYPLMPVAIAASAKRWAWLESSSKRRDNSASSSSSSSSFLVAARWLLRVGLAAQIPLAMYLSLIHQRGMETIVNKYVSKLTAEEDVFDGGVHFWTPCHEHPLYASVHKNLTMRYLECDPPNASTISSHLSSGNWRAFEKNPVAFVERKYGKSISSNSASECADDDDASDATATAVPSHVVVFARERDALARWFQSFQFKEVASVFHAHVSVDRDGQETAHLFAREKRKKYGGAKSSCSSSSSSSSS